jgi:proteasome accessory factor A
MSERLMGVETEYAISGMQGEEAADHSTIIRHLLDLAHTSLPNLQDGSSSGLFLENGARFYLDCGMHMEYSTPEVSNPWDAVRYVEAGHDTMLSLIQRIGEERIPELQTGCYRVNVDYSGTGSTWGCHESYLHRMPPADLPRDLIPHLVTRQIYTGAGGFEPFSSGLKFTLSPRAAHIDRTISFDSTNARGIFHSKNEPLCSGYNRLHVICGENLCSHVAMFVKFGATSLVVAMAEAGLAPGSAVQLDSPLSAFRTVSGDVTLKRPLKITGQLNRMTAIEIQRHYLAMAEQHSRDKFMPLWAPEVCTQWRRVLEALDSSFDAACKMLDWPIKLHLFASHAARRGMNWSRLPLWTSIVERLHRAMELPMNGEIFPLDQAISPGTTVPGVVLRIAAFLHRKGLDWDELRSLLKLRAEFYEIDTRFGQLGPRGIFQMLDRDGVLEHQVSGVDNFEYASRNPPRKSRAKIRGAVVRRLAGYEEGRWVCYWDRIFSQKYGRMLDLSDPFAISEAWCNIPREQAF